MEFPSVPLDSSMTHANMLNQYWERSTEKRSSSFIADVRDDDSDITELRNLSMDAFEPAKPIGLPTVVFQEDAKAVLPVEDDLEPLVMTEAVGPIVVPKGVNSRDLWILLIVLGVLWSLHILKRFKFI